jgi:transposase-like protein
MQGPTQEQLYDRIFDRIKKVIAHPHVTITDHDKWRAAILLQLLAEDHEFVEYIFSQLTEGDFMQLKRIRKDIDSTPYSECE